MNMIKSTIIITIIIAYIYPIGISYGAMDPLAISSNWFKAIKGGVEDMKDKDDDNNESESIKILKNILQSHPTMLNAKEDGSLQTGLMASCLSGNVKALKFLLDAGADINIPERGGFTCFHGVAFQGRADALKYLLDFGKKNGLIGQPGWDPNHKQNDGYVPLNRACWGKSKSHAKVVELFLTEGGVSLKDENIIKNPLEDAILVRNLDTIRILIKHGASVESLDSHIKPFLFELISKDEIQGIIDNTSKEL